MVSDFSNFIYEKLPPDPINGFVQRTFPLTSENLLGDDDSYESTTPELSYFLMDFDDEDDNEEDYISDDESLDMDQKFQMYETFRPKDEFSFAPTTSSFQVFEPE
jgi:hypothetical protein